MKLRTRFSLTITVLVALMSAGFIASSYLVENRYLKTESERTHRDALRKFSTVCAESVLSKDEIPLYNYVRQLSQSQDVISAQFVDPLGRIVMHTDINRKDKFVVDKTPQPEALVYQTAVEVEGHDLGHAQIIYDARKVNAAIASTLKSATRRLAAVTVVCMVLGILFAQYAAYGLALPIQNLVKGVRLIASGDFTAKIPESARDEIGELSKEFNQMSRRLGELDELKDDFIHMVSHDLRNPLFAISMSSEYLIDWGELNESQKLKISVIRRSADNLSLMVTDILDTAKMKAGKMDFNRQPVLLSALLNESAAIFELAARLRRISVTIELPKGPIMLNVDKGMTQRVLSNLLSNALKYSYDDGAIKLGALPTSAGKATLFVSNKGPGISPEDLSKIFDRFYQVKTTGGSGGRVGTGLGLSLAQSIVEGHGGRIWAESVPEIGTTFFFTLPVQEAS